MSSHFFCDLTEVIRREYLDLVHEHETPLMTHDEVHHQLRPLSSLLRPTQHAVSTDEHQCFIVFLSLVKFVQKLIIFLPLFLVYRLRSKDQDVTWVNETPFDKLSFPLLSWNLGSANNQSGFFNGTGSCDPCQSLSSSTRQNNNSGPGSPITEHLAKCLLLVVSDHCIWLELNLQVWISGVPLKVILLNERELIFSRLLLEHIQPIRDDRNPHLLLSSLL